jgi:hypothetical protein
MTEPRTYDTAVGYLRSFITVLVVAHHSVLAYHPFAPPPPASLDAVPQWWRAFPVTDGDRWSGFQWLVGWNDTFFMSLMFLLSGLFVWTSLQRKGPARFVRDRVVRLGVPWLVAIVVLSPLAYFPAFLEAGGGTIAEFWQQWLAAGSWPTGPAWFLLVLLAFDVVAAGLYRLRALPRLSLRNPLAVFGVVVGASALAYVPLSFVVDGSSWFSFGPITFQTGRLLHYAVYFFAGAALGTVGVQRFARGWYAWTAASAVAFWWLSHAFEQVIMTGATPGSAWGLALSTGFVLACATTSVAMIGLFVRFVRRSHPILDSLRDNAYGIYVVHYAFVSWLQYALLDASLSGLAKGTLVTACALGLAWGASSLVRRLRVAATPVPA